MNLKIQIKWVDKQKKQAYNKTTGENLWFVCACNLITRGGAGSNPVPATWKDVIFHYGGI